MNPTIDSHPDPKTEVFVPTTTTTLAPLTVVATHQNTDQEIVVITIDRLRLVVHEHKGCLQGSSEWQAPAGLLISFATTFFTSDFKVFLGVPADTWRALFMFATVAVVLWLLATLKKAMAKRKSVEDFVASVKSKATK